MDAHFKLRPYQIELAKKGCEILKAKRIVYYIMEVRTGKTATALRCAELFGAKKVLFLTKKLAIKSIESDHKDFIFNFDITIINNESLHKVTANDFDLIISDEHHRMSAFPKPNKNAKMLKQRFGHLPMIFLSGTPTIESGSQWYHSFWVSNYSPFNFASTFYKFANNFVNKKNKYIGQLVCIDYSDSRDELIMPIIEPYLIRYTQAEAGFTSTIDERVIYYTQNDTLFKLVQELLDKRVVQGRSETILADTAVKMLNKIHQIENGTVIFESGNSMILDKSKAEFIKENFKGKKIALFYYFQKEYELLKDVFCDELTNDLSEFQNTNKCIALQQNRGSEGISLKEADAIVYYNFGYSGRQYAQGRDRLTTKEHESNNVYFVLAKGGLNEKIYKAIKTKKRYNEKLFKKDYGIRE